MVNEHVLIPRPETEVLVSTTLDVIRSVNGRRGGLNLPYGNGADCLHILDLGTGSGCIAIALMVRLSSPLILSPSKGLTKNAQDCRIVASDISADAIETAKENARLNGVFEKIIYTKSDLFCDIEGRFDIIVSNPPYIARYEFETLQREVLKEPCFALDGGADGLDFYRRIFSAANGHLAHGGYCVVEIGFGQLPAVREIIENTKEFKLIETRIDQYGIDRVVVAQWIS